MASGDMDFLCRLLSGGIHERNLPFQMPAVTRVWDATGQLAAPLKLMRHPELFPDVIPHAQETFRVRRSRSASRGWQAKLPSRKLGRTVRARSLLEQRALERCEVDGDVTRYCEQPITITYLDREGRTRKHTPDLYYETDAIRSFVEVKWESDARLPQNEARWPAIAAAINGMGFLYEVQTERHILRRPVADNVAELLRFRRAEPAPLAVRDAVVGVLRHKPASLTDIIALVPGAKKPCLYRAIVDGWLCIDLNTLLGPHSLLRLPGSAGLSR